MLVAASVATVTAAVVIGIATTDKSENGMKTKKKKNARILNLLGLWGDTYIATDP